MTTGGGADAPDADRASGEGRGDEYFGRAPDWLFDLLTRPKADPWRLTQLDVLLWILLSRYAGLTGDAYPSHALLARRLGCTERAVRRSAEKLVKMGLVEVQRRGHRGRFNVYKMSRPQRTPGSGEITPERTPGSGETPPERTPGSGEIPPERTPGSGDTRVTGPWGPSDRTPGSWGRRSGSSLKSSRTRETPETATSGGSTGQESEPTTTTLDHSRLRADTASLLRQHWSREWGRRSAGQATAAHLAEVAQLAWWFDELSREQAKPVADLIEGAVRAFFEAKRKYRRPPARWFCEDPGRWLEAEALGEDDTRARLQKVLAEIDEAVCADPETIHELERQRDALIEELQGAA